MNCSNRSTTFVLAAGPKTVSCKFQDRHICGYTAGTCWNFQDENLHRSSSEQGTTVNVYTLCPNKKWTQIILVQFYKKNLSVLSEILDIRTLQKKTGTGILVWVIHDHASFMNIENTSLNIKYNCTKLQFIQMLTVT